MIDNEWARPPEPPRDYHGGTKSGIEVFQQRTNRHDRWLIQDILTLLAIPALAVGTVFMHLKSSYQESGDARCKKEMVEANPSLADWTAVEVTLPNGVISCHHLPPTVTPQPQ